MKHITIFLVSFFSIYSFAQVGVNTTTPNAMLDVNSATNGVLISRIALTGSNVAAPVVNPQGGAVAISTLIYNTSTVTGANSVSPGYYYWNGTLWISLSGATTSDWKLNGNSATTNPASPAIYGTSTIASIENFIGTTDANDIVLGTNNIERLRIQKGDGNVGIGTDSPAYKLHVAATTSAVAASFAENTFVGNTNGIGVEGKSTNNPGFGIGGRFTGNGIGVKAINFGAAGATTYGGEFTSSGAATTGNRYGLQGAADGGTINTGGSFLSAGATAAENFGGFLSASGGAKNIGSQSQATGPASSLNGGVFGTAGGGNNSTNYGGNFNAQTATAIGTTNYGGYFAASGGNKNYAIVVPNSGGTIGFGTITPRAMLEVESATNGVLLPRLALTVNNVAAPVVNPQGGALTISTIIYNTATVAGVNGVSPGYYYWNGLLWISLTPATPSNDWKLNGNTTITTPATPVTYGTSTIGATESFIGTLDANDVVVGTNNIERFRIKQTTGNLGIGTANPSSKLDLNGDLAIREGTAIAVLAGVNAVSLLGEFSHYRLTGAVGAFSINTISSGNDGQLITLINATATVMTIANNNVVNGITTGTGTNLVSNGTSNSSVTLIYNATLARWVVTSNSGLYNASLWSLNGNTTITTPITPITYGTTPIGTTENFVGTTNANDIVVGTNNIERLRVKQTTGNIGIGTATPSFTLDVQNNQLSSTTSRFENTAVGNADGTGVSGLAINNPGYGIGGYFSGGYLGVTAEANSSNYVGVTYGVRGRSFGDGGIGASRVGGEFSANSNSSNNYGVQGNAGFGITGNFGGKFTSIGGQVATGGDFFADNGTTVTTAGYFEAKGTTTNYGGRFATYGPGYGTGATTNYAGNFLAFGAINNYAGYFSATGGTNNYAIVVPPNSGNVGIGTITPIAKLDIRAPGNTIGLRLLSGNNTDYSYLSLGRTIEYAQIGAATNGNFFTDALDGDMAIKNFNSGKILLGASFVAPSALSIIPGGNVGIGTANPIYRFHVTNSVASTPTAYIENAVNFGGIGLEGRAIGINSGTGGKFTGTGMGISGIGVSTLGGTSPVGGAFSATSLATINYGVTANVSGGVSNNIAGYFTATGNSTNVGGYFSATGAPVNNYAIIVPPNEGRVGIGTNAPVDQLEIAGGFVRSTGYRCRTGTSGTYPGNVFNINWNGSSSQLWIDGTNVGTFQFTSDRRLKEKITTMNNNALTRVMLLKPVSFNYKNIPNTIFTGSDVVTEGFIADELQQIIPSAVNGKKDALTSEGTIQPQTLNMPPVVSVLTKAIQEQQAIIEHLLAKNSQLEQRLKLIEQQLGK